jgi:hypothetical protein
MVLLFLFLAIGESISPSPSADPQPLSINAIVQLSLTFVGIAGLLLAWRRELPGGIIALVAFLVLGMVNPRTFPWPLLAFIIPAIIFIFTAWQSRRRKKPTVLSHP